MKRKKKLRIGFTTGSASAAGAKAGILFLGLGQRLEKIDIPTPLGKRLVIPINSCVPISPDRVVVKVIKDGGDDPDATHGACIRVWVERKECGPGERKIEIRGGRGVGIVTRRGLPVPPGEPAINPHPKRQILDAVKEGLEETSLEGKVIVTIEVEDGEKIARKTLNPRLGILGGISILGTRGTVIPFSAKAYKDTISLALRVARDSGVSCVGLSTGGRSERLLREMFPHWKREAFVQIADFFRFSLEESAKMGFEGVYFSVFPGKLIKMAQGHPYTHARKSQIDFSLLSKWARQRGIEQGRCQEILRANTAREVMEIIEGDRWAMEFLLFLASRAHKVAEGFVEKVPMKIVYYVFDYNENFVLKVGDEYI